MAFRRAIGAVKDQTTIGLAKVGSNASLSDIDIAIIKATSHDEYPAEERYYDEIYSLTCYSRAFIGSCVSTISRRLSKTKNWVVALKTLMLIQKLLSEGDPAFEQEIFYSTRRGTRMLNMSDFRDSRSNCWDFSAFVRMFALYLDERLEYKVQGERRNHHHRTRSYSSSYEMQQPEEQYRDSSNNVSVSGSSPWTVATTDLSIEQVLSKIHHLQQLLERFLATKPSGSAKHNRIVIVALYSIVRDSFKIYYDITDILAILIDQFMELDIPECIKVHEILCRISNQFDELDSYYSWCKDIGVVRSSEYPEVEKITPKKLDLMDEFIREKAASIVNTLANMDRNKEEKEPASLEEKEPASLEKKEEEIVKDMNTIKALPPVEGFPQEDEKEHEPTKKDESQSKEADLINLGDDAPTSEEHEDNVALALFDEAKGDHLTPPPLWEVFNDISNWETTLVQSASHLPHQKASLGGGFDTMLLNGMYTHGPTNAALATNCMGGTGSASSVAPGSFGNPKMLALPAPSSTSGFYSPVVDPFAASLVVAPPPYVQISELEKKQRRLIEELMWQQYHRDGMQGHAALSNIQQMPTNMGSYGHGYNGYHYRY